jgi:hypothetical protein
MRVDGRKPARDDTMSFFERLKAGTPAEWRAYTEHPFTNGMADGSLPEAAFRHYLVQDYLFLIEFARAYALSVYKSPSLADMREGAAGLPPWMSRWTCTSSSVPVGVCHPPISSKPLRRPRC